MSLAESAGTIEGLGKGHKGSQIATFDEKLIRALQSLGLQTAQL